MYKLDPVTLAPKDKNNKETHIYYLKHTMEQVAILREIVEQAKSLNPLDSASYSAFKFDNDQIAKIMRYSDYQIGNIIILRVYYVEGLGHNLFFVGQFCNSNLEVAFRKHTCFVQNLEGVDLLSGSQETNLYTLSIGDMMASSPIFLLSKASKTKSWLWHRRLSHLKFGTINHLAKNGLVRGDGHLDTILATKSDEFIKSCVENLIPNPSESEGENGCDVPACFTTFSNILFDVDYEFDSSDDQSLFDEDFPKEIYSNPLFEEEINSIRIDPHHFNTESDLLESLLNRDSSIIPSSSKIDSLLDEFVNELTLLKSILTGIDKTDCYPEETIHLTKRLLYDNSSRPPEEFVSENSNAEIKSFSPSPIPVEDSDSRMEEIDLSFNPDDPMPLGIEEEDVDSERYILILKELPSNYSLSLPVNESFYFDIPSFSCPPAKPPDGNTKILNIKMMGDNSEQKVPITGLTITRVSNQEKSPDLLSHRCLDFFQLFAKCPMMIHGKNIPIIDVPLFHFYPLDQLKYGGSWLKLSDLKQALRGRHPMLISSLVFLFSS
nr:integrase, catalytic region, zinc finger, CCHC-type, peptidase aspartic, catalytic [Tanacetum cinerariifolium]